MNVPRKKENGRSFGDLGIELSLSSCIAMTHRLLPNQSKPHLRLTSHDVII